MTLPDEETLRELARRMGGGHPSADVRGEMDAITTYPEGEAAKAQEQPKEEKK